MKYICIILLSLLSFSWTNAQLTDDEKKVIYPDTYSFERAEKFEAEGEIEKTIWFYINLYPNAKVKVVESVKLLQTKLDTIDMSVLIKQSFAMYGMFDPEINSFENGSPQLDMSMLKLKGSWGDDLIEAISDEKLSAKDYNFRGLDKIKKRDYAGAIADFDLAISIEETGQFYFNRAFAKSLNSDFKNSISDFDKTIEFKYRLAEAYFEKGYCLDQLGNHRAAIENYDIAIKENNSYSEAYNNRAFSKFKQEDFKGALKDFNKAIKLDPKFAPAYVNRGFTKSNLKDDKGACEDWNKALDLGFTQAAGIIKKYCE